MRSFARQDVKCHVGPLAKATSIGLQLACLMGPTMASSGDFGTFGGVAQRDMWIDVVHERESAFRRRECWPRHKIRAQDLAVVDGSDCGGCQTVGIDHKACQCVAD